MTKIYEMKRSGKAFLVMEEPVFSSLTEERMLIKAEAGCFLRPRRIFEQEKAGLCYDVSGLQSLRLFCEGRRNSRVFISKLFRSLCEAAIETGRFMLSEDNICLSPEYIFLTDGGEEIKLLLAPAGPRGGFKEDLRSLMEYMLMRADTEDIEGLRLLCRMYQYLGSEDICIEGLYDIVRRGSLGLGNTFFKVGLSSEKDCEEEFGEGGISELRSTTGDALEDTEEDMDWLRGRTEPVPSEKEEPWSGEEGDEGDIRTGSFKLRLLMAMGIMGGAALLVIFLRGITAFMRMLPIFLVLCISIVIFLFLSSMERKGKRTEES